MEKKRVLYVLHGGARGGALLSLFSLVQKLDPNNIECIICSSENDAGVLSLFNSHGYSTCSCRLRGFEHTTLGSYNLLKPSGWRRLIRWIYDYHSACFRLEKLLRDIQPDLVHFNSLILAPYACVPARRGIPNIVHVREPVIQGIFGIRRKWLIGQLNRYAGRVIAICQDNLNRLKPELGQGQVIYNPVDFKKFDATINKQETRAALEIAPDAKVALFAGGSTPDIKGRYEFLKAMIKVKELNPRTVCLMPSFNFPIPPQKRQWTLKRRIGWLLGIYRKNDHRFRLIEEGGLRERIIASDFTYEIERWIAASDVVCVPHIKPHFSRTIIEAGAMKKPVVASRIGGIEEIVMHRKTGLLVEVGDIAGLAQAIQELFTNESLCRQLGENGWQQAKRVFSAEIIAAQVVAVYEELFSNHKMGKS